jgi:hypothetical protein
MAYHPLQEYEPFRLINRWFHPKGAVWKELTYTDTKPQVGRKAAMKKAYRRRVNAVKYNERLARIDED